MSGMQKLVESVVRATLDEAPKKIEQVVGVYVGRFQPFHAGHFNTYKEMVKEFGQPNVFIATSNVSGGDRHPFNFKEKDAFNFETTKSNEEPDLEEMHPSLRPIPTHG